MVSTALLIDATAYHAAAAVPSGTAAAPTLNIPRSGSSWSRRQSLIFAVAASAGLWGVLFGVFLTISPDLLF
jgi:hypothetical protein